MIWVLLVDSFVIVRGQQESIYENNLPSSLLSNFFIGKDWKVQISESNKKNLKKKTKEKSHIVLVICCFRGVVHLTYDQYIETFFAQNKRHPSLLFIIAITLLDDPSNTAWWLQSTCIWDYWAGWLGTIPKALTLQAEAYMVHKCYLQMYNQRP